jgi:hypothetical protein
MKPSPLKGCVLLTTAPVTVEFGLVPYIGEFRIPGGGSKIMKTCQWPSGPYTIATGTTQASTAGVIPNDNHKALVTFSLLCLFNEAC